jgi:hypothetical protein
MHRNAAKRWASEFQIFFPDDPIATHLRDQGDDFRDVDTNSLAHSQICGFR